MLAQFVQLDSGLQSLIVVALTFVVSFLILKVAAIYPPLGEYLGQYKAAIVTWLAGLVFNLLQAQLDNIPVSWEGVAALAMKLIVEVFAVLLSVTFLRSKGVRL